MWHGIALKVATATTIHAMQADFPLQAQRNLRILGFINYLHIMYLFTY